MEELRPREPGDEGVEEPGVVAVAEVGFARALAAAAAAAGLQCAQTKMLKPRPLQVAQIEPLVNALALAFVEGSKSDVCMYLGAFPAQLLHVTTVRPPMHDTCSGSRVNKALVELDIVLEGEGWRNRIFSAGTEGLIRRRCV